MSRAPQPKRNGFRQCPTGSRGGGRGGRCLVDLRGEGHDTQPNKKMDHVLFSHGILGDVIQAIKNGHLSVNDVVCRLKSEFPDAFVAATAAPVPPPTTAVVTPVAAVAAVAAMMPPPTATPTAKRAATLKLPENTTPCPENFDTPRMAHMATEEHTRAMNTAVREADQIDPYRTLGAIKALPVDAPARMQMDSVGRFGCKICGEVHNIAKLHHEDLPCLEKNTRIIKNFLIEYDAAANQRWRELFIARENPTQTSFALWERFLTIVMPSDRHGHDDSAWAMALRKRSIATEKSRFSIWAGTCKELFDRGEHLHYMSPASHLSHVSARKLAERVENAGGVGSLATMPPRPPKRTRASDESAGPAAVAAAPTATPTRAGGEYAAAQGLCALGATGTFGIPQPDFEYTNLM